MELNVPVRPGSPEQFAELRDALRQAGFEEASIAKRFGSRAAPDGLLAPDQIVTALDLCAALFLDGRGVPRRQIEELLSQSIVEILEALGLLRPDRFASEIRHATTMLYPVRGLYVASDRVRFASDEQDRKHPSDIVFSALTPNTQRYLSLLPQDSCESLFEIGTGSGVAALLAARYAQRVWAGDVSERSCCFAEFNRRLNGLESVSVAQGGVYEAVKSLSFDRIIAHPPYIPSFEKRYVYRDGGIDGENVTRQIIEGLPYHLRPGGRFYGYGGGVDKVNDPLEQRFREMLGSAQAEFDILIAVEEVLRPLDHFVRLAASGGISLSESEGLLEAFRQRGIERFVKCAIVIQRKTESRRAYTDRRKMGSKTASAELEKGLRIAARAISTDPEILDARPVANPDLACSVVNRMVQGEWCATECIIETEKPFLIQAKCQPWAAVLVSGCDGKRTLREQFTALKNDGLLPHDAVEAELVRFARNLIEEGFLEIPEQRPS